MTLSKILLRLLNPDKRGKVPLKGLSSTKHSNPPIPKPQTPIPTSNPHATTHPNQPKSRTRNPRPIDPPQQLLPSPTTNERRRRPPSPQLLEPTLSPLTRQSTITRQQAIAAFEVLAPLCRGRRRVLREESSEGEEGAPESYE